MDEEQNSNDDLLVIIEDEPATLDTTSPKLTWRVLIVDDDPDLHHATTLSLKDIIIENRPIEFLHAYSAAEAEQVLSHETDIGVILLDVVMETDRAGLELVETIREKLHLSALRIILRTGQPGYAPEMETIQRYDINDYRTKPELTRIRLFTILTSAIRAYQQICNQHTMRQGLEKVVKASTELAHYHGMRMFAEGAVKQISAIIQIEPDGLICVQESLSDCASSSAQIIAAAGRYQPYVQSPIEQLDSHNIRDRILTCLEKRENQLEDGLTLYFSTEHGRKLAAYVDVNRPLESVDQHLLEVLCANLSVGFDNVLLYNRLEQQAFTDPLLNIPNLNSLLQYQLSSSQSEHSQVMALIDIDDFSVFNDSFGHKLGDDLLIAVSERLSHAFPNCFLSRVGSDVFAIIGSQKEVTDLTISNVFQCNFTVDDQPFKVMASIGLVELCQGEELSERYKDAQVALKQAKMHHRGAAMTFSQNMGQNARDRMQLLIELKQALEENALFLMYQPKYNLNTLELTGIEALLRWRNKHGDLVPPDQFIPLAEQSGMMVNIGAFVIERACQQFNQLLNSVGTQITLAINISPTQLDEPEFVHLLESSLKQHAIAPQQIELEITETIAAKNLSALCDVLNQVRELGCKIAIDDFGTGFSSLSILHKLPATRLKIDRSFVDAMEEDCSIAKMIVNLGQTLGLQITAEGIETSFQHDKLKAFHCEEGQGWLFAKAMEMEQLITFVSQPDDKQ